MTGPESDRVWVTLEVGPDSPSELQTLSGNAGGLYLGGLKVIRIQRPPETKAEKSARLFREAAEEIRAGVSWNEPVGSERLRSGLLKVAEALESYENPSV